MVTSELKKGYIYPRFESQLHAEAFNVLISKCVRQAKEGMLPGAMVVYCILLFDDCKQGRISKLSVDFDNQTCTIYEDTSCRQAHECFNIALDG